MDTETRTRDRMLRRMLVATVDSGLPTPRPAWRTAALSVGAFALAGALAGGTTVAVGALQAEPAAYDGTLEISRPDILDDDVVILGTPHTVAGREDAVIDLGAAPEAANGLVFQIYCLEPGFYRVDLDDQPFTDVTCTSESERPKLVSSAVETFDGSAPRTITIDLDSGGYLLWAAWLDQPADAEPSAAQQDALADGVVSREEYVAGFERYVACMADIGFVVSHGPLELEVLSYSIPGDAGHSGAANRCYEAEFLLVDQEWQVAHPQTSDEQTAALIGGVVTRAEYLAGFDRFVECVTPLGITVSVVDRDAEVLDYTVDASGGQPGEANRCYRLEFFSIDLAWRASVEQ
jgi:hypothetical protein